MITRQLREWVQSGLIDHIRRHPSWYPIPPNVLTFGALVLAVPACWAIADGRYPLAVLFIILSGAVDLVDGEHGCARPPPPTSPPPTSLEAPGLSLSRLRPHLSGSATSVSEIRGRGIPWLRP